MKQTNIRRAVRKILVESENEAVLPRDFKERLAAELGLKRTEDLPKEAVQAAQKLFVSPRFRRGVALREVLGILREVSRSDSVWVRPPADCFTPPAIGRVYLEFVGDDIVSPTVESISLLSPEGSDVAVCGVRYDGWIDSWHRASPFTVFVGERPVVTSESAELLMMHERAAQLFPSSRRVVVDVEIYGAAKHWKVVIGVPRQLLEMN